MALEKRANAEPIPGYRLIAPLGNGGFGEVWKCEAPGGIFKAIKFVYGDMNGLDADSARAEEELRSVQHIKTIRHPFLLSIDRVECIDGELAIVTELADHNLEECFGKYRERGQEGIPRGDLLGYLREAAEVLDVMNLQYQLQHLDIKPRNLFLVSNHVKVADFGLVNPTGNQKGLNLGAITPLYAAPELFLGQLSSHCDQYSLAIVYQELLTGTLPYQGKNARQLLLQHTRGEPDLKALPAEDRPILAKALAKDPKQRFSCCQELVQALLRPTPGNSASLDNTLWCNTENLLSLNGSGETVRNLGPDTERLTKKKGPNIPDHVLADYRFLESLGNTPLVDLWKVQGADGRSRLVKFIYGFSFPDEHRLSEVVQQFSALHHPALVETEIVYSEPGRLILLTDLAQESMRDRFMQCQARKMSGIMRNELIDYLRAAAEALDYLYQQHSLQHLSLNPRHLILDNGWLQIAEFGLAQLLWLPAGQAVAQRNARYAAPELFDKHISPASDQYSLALIFAEMLTGAHPFRGNPPPGLSRSQTQPDLGALPVQDRDIIARALHPDPTQRWPNATALAQALAGSRPAESEGPDRFDSFLKSPRAVFVPIPAEVTPGDLNKIIADLITSISGEETGGETANSPRLTRQGELTYKFEVPLPRGSARLKIDEFCRQWFGQLTHDDENGCVIHLSMPSNFWRQWVGRQPGLEVQIQLARVQSMSATPIEVSATIRAFRTSQRRGAELVEKMGPVLLDSLRKLLLVNSEKRQQKRLLWPHPLKIIPIHPDGSAGEAFECLGKDISQNGIGFYLPHELTTSEVLIQLPNTLHPPFIAVPASLVRARRCADGWYEVGALFRLPAVKKSEPELCVR